MHVCNRCSDAALPERCPDYETDEEEVNTHAATADESDVLTAEEDAELWQLFLKMRREYRCNAPPATAEAE